MNQFLNKFKAILVRNGFSQLEHVPCLDIACFKHSAKNNVFRLIYLGRKQIYTNRFAPALSQKQILDLQHLGVDVKTNLFSYSGGLVNISTTDGTPVNILAFNKNIIDLLKSIKNAPDSAFAKSANSLCESLIYGLSVQMQLPTDNCVNNNYAACYREIFEEQQTQFSELCTLFLPSDFLIQLSEPVYFLKTIAKLIGFLLFQTIAGGTNEFYDKHRKHHILEA